MKPHIIQPFIDHGDPTKYIVISRSGCDMCVADRDVAAADSLCRRLPGCGSGGGGLQFLEYTPENLAFAATQILEGKS